MSFEPLDTSTQRERINMSRSGTMGVRRPPTRRHTPAPPVVSSSSPEPDEEGRGRSTDEIIDDSDETLRSSPDYAKPRLNESTGLSIVGFKNISPKIRVGFPVEIQLELQSKLRSSTNLNREDSDSDDIDPHHSRVPNLTSGHQRGGSDDGGGSGNLYRHHKHRSSTLATDESTEELNEGGDHDSAIPLFELSTNKGDLTFDFKQRRKSYGFESFEARQSDLARSGGLKKLGIFPTSAIPIHHHAIVHERDSCSPNASQSKGNHDGSSETFSAHRTASQSHLSGLSPSGIPSSRSWDLIQSAHSSQQKREANKKFFKDTTHTYSTSAPSPTSINRSSEIGKLFSNSSQKTVLTLNSSNDDGDDGVSRDQETYGEARIFSMNAHSSSDLRLESRKKSSFMNSPPIVEQEEVSDSLPSSHTPDVLHHEYDSSILSPSLDRSRKLLKMLNEAPDLLHKMSYKNYFSKSENHGEEDNDKWREQKDGADWETQRQLSFLNESLTRILDEGRSKENNLHFDKTGIRRSNEINDYATKDGLNIYRMDASATDYSTETRDYNNEEDDLEIMSDSNGNGKAGAVGLISQTWISSGDAHKPAQKVRDNDVITSIAATNDPFKRGPKKVEFCKTEVHFTADSGKFHIVETDENKPSTSHLFRRKKKGDKKKSLILASSSSPLKSEDLNLRAIDGIDTKLKRGDQEQSTVEGVFTSTQSEISSHSTNKISADILISSGVGGVEILHLQPQEKSTTDKEGQSKNYDETIIHRIQQQPTGSESTSSTPYSLNLKNNSYITSSTRGELKVKNGTAATSAPAKFLPILSLHRETVNDGVGEVALERSHIVMNMDGHDEMPSPSHTILSNYGEMKIQRYLKQLKSPSSLQSEESPSELDDLVVDPDQEYPSHFRFDNVLYENGSFVPLATRRSLIEMNNRNRKRNTVSQLSTNSSSTMSNYSLPNSDKENSASEFQSFRLARMEAKVETNKPKPQITQVELRYELDSNEVPKPSISFKESNSYASDTFRKQSSSNAEEHQTSSTAYAVSSSSRLPAYANPTSADSDLIRNTYSATPDGIRSSNYHVSASSTTSHDVQGHYDSAFDKIRDKSIYQNPYDRSDSDAYSTSSTRLSDYMVSTGTMTTSSRNGKNSSKSIVTIGDYEVTDMSKYQNTIDNQGISPEPVLSMDHTWKGPAHFEMDGSSPPPETSSPTMKSLTLTKSSSEPEWVYKARSRELRVTDWDLVGKQPAPSPNPVRSEPPWMDEIMRVRNRGPATEEVKALPKISVVYPWQRGSDGLDSMSRQNEDEKGPQDEEIEEQSHIVSLVPAPPLPPRKDADGRKYLSTGLKAFNGRLPEVSVVQISRVEMSDHDIRSKDDLAIKSNSHILDHSSTSKEDFKSHSPNNQSNNKQSSNTSAYSLDRQSANISNKKASKVVRNTGNQHSRTADGPPIPSQRKSTHLNAQVSKEKNSTLMENMTSTSGNEASLRKVKPTNLKKMPSLKKVDTEGYELAGKQLSSKVSSTDTAQKDKRSRIGNIKKSDMEESSGSSRANTPIVHQHPTVKVSKLPIRNKSASSSGKTYVETKPVTAFGSRVKSREKHHGQYKLGDKLSVSCRLF
jgi:hypothetical protein